MWRIREAVTADAVELAQLAEKTFRDAFQAFNAKRDIDAYCAQAFTPEIQSRDLADPVMTTFVADDRGELIAYAQLRRGAAPALIEPIPAAELRRIYVHRMWQGTGVAAELMRTIAEAASTGIEVTLWLAVWEHNHRAIRFYARHGFLAAGEQPFLLGGDQQRDVIMSAPIETVLALVARGR